jgi:hypothetical protein
VVGAEYPGLVGEQVPISQAVGAANINYGV